MNTEYGKNKRDAEILIQKELDDLWILRFTWMFGVPERNRPVVANILWDTVKSALRGERTRVPTEEYRGLTYVNELMDQFGKVFELPFGTYHVGSRNDKDRYEIVRFILEELGLGSRVPELVEKDEKKYAETPRDARLDTSKIQSRGFHFSETTEALRRCIAEYQLAVETG